MYRRNKIAVVVPCFNEEKLLGRVLVTMPEFVDTIVVVDDKSLDETLKVAETFKAHDNRIVIIGHGRNKGVGAAISSGYIWCLKHEMDIVAVMAGDAQMAPEDLCSLLDPVVEGLTDFAKGNRLADSKARKLIPRSRFFGNYAMSFLTRFVSGYWHISDSQTGYTAISSEALGKLPLDDIYPGYGMPNDFLVTLNIYNMRVMDVPVKPVYGIGEKSGLNVGLSLFTMSSLLLRLFCRRMIQKYIIRDFHPLALMALFGVIGLLMNLPLIASFFYVWIKNGVISETNGMAILLCSFVCFPVLIFSMLFDMENNRNLKGGIKKEPGL